jgi:hypothetical protein
LNIGGIAGSLDGSGSIQNSYGGLDLTVNITNDVYAGGLAGFLGGTSRIEASTVRGDMNISGARIDVGGITGHIKGTSESDLAVITDCVYETGEIEGTAESNGVLYLGGITGFVDLFAGISDCNSRAGHITATAESGVYFYLGGFAGHIFASEVLNCGSSSPITMIGVASGAARIGGFAGQITDMTEAATHEYSDNTKLVKCWAIGSVNAQGSKGLSVGGLVGESWDWQDDAATVISQCYATGDVNAVSSALDTEYITGRIFAIGGLVGLALGTEIRESWAGGEVTAQRTTNDMIYAGGLVGNLGDYTGSDSVVYPNRSSISDCYARGDVLADKSATGTGNVYAGALVGQVYIGSSYTIEHSFALGSVTAQSAGTADHPIDPDITSKVYAGGVIGNKTVGGALSHCATLGAKIVATGGSTRNAARVYAASAGTAPANNYAVKTMKTETSNTYKGTLDINTPDSSDSASQNGKNVADDGTGLRYWYFWNYDLRFNPSLWNFADVTTRGYPLLTNTGGQ